MTGDEDALLRSAALRNASAILQARQRAEAELLAAKDALERKTRELDRSLATVRATLEATTDAILVTDTEGRVSDFNANFVQMWRLQPAVLAGSSVRGELRAAIAVMLVEPQQFAAQVDAVEAGGGNTSLGSLALVDGRVVELYSHVQQVDGDRVGRVWSFRDVTEQRRAEQALRDESRVLDLLNRTGTVIAATLDLQALLQAVTDAATEVSGARIGACFYNTSDAAGGAYLLHALCGAPREAFERFGQPRATAVFAPTFNGEGPVRCDDVQADPRYGRSAPHHGLPLGHPPVRSYLAVPVVSRSGAVIGGLLLGHPEVGVFNQRAERLVCSIASQAAIAIDNARLYDGAVRLAAEREQLINAERAARAESERLGRMKDEFLATLSHELRTPLSAILGWARVLQAKPDEVDSVTRGVDAIARNALAQAKLIDELLDMNRIVSGKVRLDVHPTDLATVIEAAIETIRPLIEAKQLRLRKILDPLAGPVFGDPHRLQQVIWNLLTNASKFTPKGGSIDVTLERVNSHLELVVHDSGCGIDPEFLPHVFDRFRQADSSTTRQYGGLGLGLSIVKSLVELHGGSVRVDSAGVDLGATFTVTLPQAPLRGAPAPLRGAPAPREHPASASAAALPPKLALDLGGIKVLVVDDEPDVCELLSKLLTDAGARVVTAGSAAQALPKLAQERPDVLVSDIGMPQVDGYQFMREVRGLAATSGGHTPAIALTAFARSEDRTHAMMAGYQVHMSKPVEPVELIATINGLVVQARAHAGDGR